MKQPKILVTGATGRRSSVVYELLAKGVPVRALVHSKDARSVAMERPPNSTPWQKIVRAVDVNVLYHSLPG